MINDLCKNEFQKKHVGRAESEPKGSQKGAKRGAQKPTKITQGIQRDPKIGKILENGYARNEAEI